MGNGNRPRQAGQRRGGGILAEIFADCGPNGRSRHRICSVSEPAVGHHRLRCRLCDLAAPSVPPPTQRCGPRPQCNLRAPLQFTDQRIESPTGRRRGEQRHGHRLGTKPEPKSDTSILGEHPTTWIEEMIRPHHESFESDRSELPRSQPASTRPDADPSIGVMTRANRFPQSLSVDQGLSSGCPLPAHHIDGAIVGCFARPSPVDIAKRRMSAPNSLGLILGLDRSGEPRSSFYHCGGRSSADGLVTDLPQPMTGSTGNERFDQSEAHDHSSSSDKHSSEEGRGRHDETLASRRAAGRHTTWVWWR